MAHPRPVAGADAVSFGTPAGRWVVLATVLGSGMAQLDATVVNVALPAIGADLETDLAGLQWTLDGYLLTLAALILVGGALGDRFGRRRVFIVGVVWFAVASALCGLAPSAPVLSGARALQGMGGALLTPGSLAILQATFREGDRSRAIGAWSGLGGVAAAVGPFVGGWLIDSVSWRLIFLVNLPVAAVVVAVAARHVPETRDPGAVGRIDVAGAVLGAVGLAGVTSALIEAPERGSGSPVVVAAAVAGVAGLVGFLVVEARRRHPMLPLAIFRSRSFTGANLTTFTVYAALAGALFLLVVHLQQVLGYSALEAGASLFPITILMLALSARAGALATRIGPRLPMTVGPLVVAIALALLSRVGPGATYAADVLPAVFVFGLGLSLTVAPLTATVLAAAPTEQAGVASGVNNAVARVAGLLAVAVLPLLAGITGEAYLDPVRFDEGFGRAMWMAAALAAAGGAVAFAVVRDPSPVARRAAQPHDEHHHCAVDAPPLAAREQSATAGGGGSGARVAH